MKSWLAVGEERRVLEGSKDLYVIPGKHPSRSEPVYHDLVYMIKGNWDILVEGTVYQINPGDVFFLPAGSTYIGNSPCAKDTTTYHVHFLPAEHDMTGWREPMDDGVFRLSLPVIIHCQENEQIQNLFKELLMLVESEQPGKEKILSAMLDTLFYLLSQTAMMNSARNPQLIERSLEIMTEYPDRFLKDSEVAGMNGVSVNTLRAAFVKHFGKTFYRYQMDSKLHTVCYYLDNHPEMTMRAIAYELGFYDEFHLSKCFKRTYGISPYEYKKKNKE